MIARRSRSDGSEGEFGGSLVSSCISAPSTRWNGGNQRCSIRLGVTAQRRTSLSATVRSSSGRYPHGYRKEASREVGGSQHGACRGDESRSSKLTDVHPDGLGECTRPVAEHEAADGHNRTVVASEHAEDRAVVC